MAKKRITELATETTLKDGQYVAIDHATDGTKKLNLGAELTDLKKDLDLSIGELKRSSDYYEPINWFNSNDTEPYNESFVYSNYIPAKLNDVFQYYQGNNASALAHGTPRNWMYYDSNKTLLGETSIWTQDYTVTSNSVAYVRAVVSTSHQNRMIEKNQNPAITVYSDYFAPYYVANDTTARADISDTNERITELVYEETTNFEGTYQKGTLSSGNYSPLNYRVAETDLLSFPCTKIIYIKDGFRVGFHGFKNGVFAFDSGWKTGFYYIPKGYQFKFVVARVSESTSEDIADINEFINAVYYKTDLINAPLTVNQCMMVFAHQGFSVTSEYYGNSRLSSYVGAYVHGFDCAETDVQWSSDNVPMCCHDATFTDTDDGETVITIANHTAAELQTYGYYGETIATLEEVIATCKKYGLKLEIDKIVSSWSDSQWETVFGIVSKYQMQEHIIWTCGDNICADKILDYDKYATLMLNTSKDYITATIGQAKGLITDDCKILIACNYSGFSVNDLISSNALVPERNISIGVWTIDDMATFLQYMPYAAFITSNKLCASDVI